MCHMGGAEHLPKELYYFSSLTTIYYCGVVVADIIELFVFKLTVGRHNAVKIASLSTFKWVEREKDNTQEGIKPNKRRKNSNTLAFFMNQKCMCNINMKYV